MLGKRLFIIVGLTAVLGGIGLISLMHAPRWRTVSSGGLACEIRDVHGHRLHSVFEGLQASRMSPKQFKQLVSLSASTAKRKTRCEPDPARSAGLLSWMRPATVHAQGNNCEYGAYCQSCGLLWYDDSGLCNNCEGLDYTGGGPWQNGAKRHLFSCAEGGSCCYWTECRNDDCYDYNPN